MAISFFIIAVYEFKFIFATWYNKYKLHNYRSGTMYKYFQELDNQAGFRTYLVEGVPDKKEKVIGSKKIFSDEFLRKLGVLFPRLNIIDDMIIGLHESLLRSDIAYNSLPYDTSFGAFFQHREESYLATHCDLKENVDLTFGNMRCILGDISSNIPYLIIFYPDYKDFLLKTKDEIDALSQQIKMQCTIELPSKRAGVEVNWPKAWYITPNGYLYNTGTNLGHKKGNLVYDFYYIICELLEQNKEIDSVDYRDHISSILRRGYITDGEFQNYCHLMYKLPTIVTPEVERDLERKKHILAMSDEEYRKTVLSSGFEWPHTSRSYQKNFITLIVGHLAAENALYLSFNRFNNSESKRALIHQLREMTVDDISDVLVRFCGFHKVESMVDNTITTSSLYGISSFSEYLRRGWNLHIIPGIIYDQVQDKLSEVDFNSYFISKHLDKELARYEGKGKVLVKDRWVS